MLHTLGDTAHGLYRVHSDVGQKHLSLQSFLIGQLVYCVIQGINPLFKYKTARNCIDKSSTLHKLEYNDGLSSFKRLLLTKNAIDMS